MTNGPNFSTCIFVYFEYLATDNVNSLNSYLVIPHKFKVPCVHTVKSFSSFCSYNTSLRKTAQPQYYHFTQKGNGIVSLD